MSERHTDVEDLTDDGVREILGDLTPDIGWMLLHPTHQRDALRDIVTALDRTGADWPHIILGLEPTP